MEEKRECPVCGKYIFDDDYGYCEVCGWFNDPYMYDHPDYAGGALKMSFNEAIEAWKNGIPIE